jgi:hypothetical protein
MTQCRENLLEGWRDHSVYRDTRNPGNRPALYLIDPWIGSEESDEHVTSLRPQWEVLKLFRCQLLSQISRTRALNLIDLSTHVAFHAGDELRADGEKKSSWAHPYTATLFHPLLQG